MTVMPAVERKWLKVILKFCNVIGTANHSTAGTRKKASYKEQLGCFFGFRRLLKICIIIKLNGFYLTDYFIAILLLYIYCLCEIIVHISTYVLILILFFSHDPISAV